MLRRVSVLNYARLLMTERLSACRHLQQMTSNDNKQLEMLNIQYQPTILTFGQQRQNTELKAVAATLYLQDRVKYPHQSHHIVSIGDRQHQSDILRTILDHQVTAVVIGDHAAHWDAPIIDDPNYSMPEIKARHIQKIRRWHMNRHRLKRVRRKMKMVYRKNNFRKKKRKEAALQAEMAAIRADGENFVASIWIKERLERAKRGGYRQDLWKSQTEQPSVIWKPYQLPQYKLKRYEKSIKQKS